MADSTALRPRWGWLWLLGLVAVLFLVYQPVWRGGLLWDDDAHVTSPALRSGEGLRRIWFEIGATQQYYPLLHTAFWVQYKLWGEATLGYHLVNIALHATAAVLLALILRRLAVPGAYLAAAIFALHPINVESVAWITEQKNTLSAVFYLAAALTYLRFDQTRGRRFYALALGLFVLGLLSKTVTATLPAALLVVFWWQRGRLSWRRDVLPLVPFFVLGAAAGALTAWVEVKLIGAEGAEFDFTLPERLLIAGRVIWFYLGKLAWPADLMFVYPRWSVCGDVWWQYLFPGGALVLLAVLWGLRRRTRGPLAALLLFVGTLFPVLGFFNVYPFRYSLVADHFQYLASLGMISLASAAAALLVRRWPRPARWAGQAIGLGLLLTLAALTCCQCRMYANALTLYEATLDRNPDCWMIHNNLGFLLSSLGRTDEAMSHFQQALQLKPDYAKAHHNLGAMLVGLGRTDAAIEHFQAALRLHGDDPTAHNRLGVALAKTGKPAEAIEEYRQALRLRPEYAEAHNNLAAALAEAGQADEAIEHYQQALQLKPDYAEAHHNLANTLAPAGRVEEAIAHWEQALRLKPDYVEAHHNLGAALASLDRSEEAIEHFRQAIRLRPTYAQAHDNLAQALAKVGRIPEAIGHWEQAVWLKPDDAAVQNRLADALAAAGRTSQAIAHYRQAVQLAPPLPTVLNNLAWLLATCGPADGGDGAQAVQLAQQARELSGRENAPCLDTLATAYAAAGRFSDATTTAEMALRLAQAAGQTALAQRIQSRLELYRAGQPYREPPRPPKPGTPE